MKFKKSLLIIILCVVFFAGVSCAYALDVKNYPNIPGLPNLNTQGEGPTFPEYIKYIFGALIYMAGIIALISFSIGAVQLVISLDSAEASSNAKERMKGAVLGLALTVTSFIIMDKINPNIIDPTLAPLDVLSDVYYTNGSSFKPVGKAVPDVKKRGEELIKNGYNSIIYKCSPGSETHPNLIIWTFPSSGLESGNGYENVQMKKMACGASINISGLGSFRWEVETPGVYFFLGSDCNGYRSNPKTTSTDDIGEPFAGKTRSIEVINNTKSNFGVIFHLALDLANGEVCSKPMFGSFCQNVVDPNSTYSANIFSMNDDPKTSGPGVKFFSKPFGEMSEANAGFFPANNVNIFGPNSGPVWRKNAAAMDFIYTGVSVDDDYRGLCPTFQSCPGAIVMGGGDYIVAVYSKNSWCQTFTSDVENLNAQPIVAPGSGSSGLEDIYIIATK